MKEIASRFFYQPCQRLAAGGVLQVHELFCGGKCHQNHFQRSSNGSLRRQLFELDKGVCQTCGLNCSQLVERVRLLGPTDRKAELLKAVPALKAYPERLKVLVDDPCDGNLWHADHILPVSMGGGECGLENIRTLCVLCHARVTAEQHRLSSEASKSEA
mmetsp:Transcript_1945/g.3107  ORF Transcript_1945/g.3107 Transcript_1945/m.3107 type:complete len:159 (-) Transcript_1945:84-560(-)